MITLKKVFSLPLLWLLTISLVIRLYPVLIGYPYYVGEDPYFHLAKIERLLPLHGFQLARVFFERSMNNDGFGGYPPLMHVIAVALSSIMPLKSVMLLLPSLFGAMTGLFVYLITIEFFDDEHIGILAAALSLFAMDNVRNTASNFMPQNLGVLLSLWMIFLFVRVYKKNDLAKNQGGLALLVVLGWCLVVGYTSYFPLFAFILLTAFTLMVFREKKFSIFYALLLVFGASLVFSAPYIFNVSYHPASVFHLFWDASLRDVLIFPFRLGLFSFLFFPLGVYWVWTNREIKINRWIIFLYVWSAILFFLSFVQVLANPTPPARYIVLLIFPVSIVSAYGLSQYKMVRGYKYFIFIMLLLAIVSTLYIEKKTIMEKLSISRSDYYLMQYLKKQAEQQPCGKKIVILAAPSSITRYYLRDQKIILDERQYLDLINDAGERDMINGNYIYVRHTDKYFYRTTPQLIRSMNKRFPFKQTGGAVIYKIK